MKNKNTYLPVNQIKVSPPVRKAFDEDRMQELVVSMRQNGVIHPLAVKQSGEEIHLVAGERRLRAAKELGMEEVPVYFVQGDETQLSLVENLHHEPLHAVELGEAVLQLRKKGRYTQEQLSELLCKPLSDISNMLLLVKLPEEVRKECNGDHEWNQERLTLIARQPRKDMYPMFEELKKYDSFFMKLQRVRESVRTLNEEEKQQSHIREELRKLRNEINSILEEE